jgi:hypothetical protein
MKDFLLCLFLFPLVFVTPVGADFGYANDVPQYWNEQFTTDNIRENDSKIFSSSWTFQSETADNFVYGVDNGILWMRHENDGNCLVESMHIYRALNMNGSFRVYSSFKKLATDADGLRSAVGLLFHTLNLSCAPLTVELAQEIVNVQAWASNGTSVSHVLGKYDSDAWVNFDVKYELSTIIVTWWESSNSARRVLDISDIYCSGDKIRSVDVFLFKYASINSSKDVIYGYCDFVVYSQLAQRMGYTILVLISGLIGSVVVFVATKKHRF